MSKAFWFELCQIPYSYTVEGTYRFSVLDLIVRVLEELSVEVHNFVQEVVMKIICKKKKCKKEKWLSEEALQKAEKREVKEKKRKDIHMWMQGSKE